MDIRGQLTNILVLSLILFVRLLAHAMAAGPYNIDESCDQLFHNGFASYSALLEKDIKDLRSNVGHQVRLDLLENLHTSLAYRAFFKSPESAVVVKQTFYYIHSGPQIQIDNNPPAAITFVCLPNHNPADQEALQFCNNNPHAGILVSGRYPPKLWLCPRVFLEWWPAAPQHALCPILNGEGKMIPNDQAVFSPEGILPLHGNRQTMILHELAHYYSPFGNVYGKEVYDPQAAAELPAEKQLTETYNYALYYAALLANCTELYQPPQVEYDNYDNNNHDELRKLLRAANTRTSPEGIEMLNLTAAGGGYLDGQGHWHWHGGSGDMVGYDRMP